MAPSELSEDELEATLQSVARLIDQYGSKYWPIFERIETELEALRGRHDRLKDVLMRSKSLSK